MSLVMHLLRIALDDVGVPNPKEVNIHIFKYAYNISMDILSMMRKITYLPDISSSITPLSVFCLDSGCDKTQSKDHRDGNDRLHHVRNPEHLCKSKR